MNDKTADRYLLTFRSCDDGMQTVLPPQAAECLGPRPVVTIGHGRRLRLLDADSWAQLAKRFEALAPSEQAKVRVLFSSADETELDGDVICISEMLVRYAGIKENAVLTFEETDPGFGAGWFLCAAD